MNRLLITLLFVSLVTFVKAQDSKVKEQSNADKFSERAGVLIRREYEDAGDVKRCKIQIAKYTDLINNQSTKALRFEYEYRSLSTSSETKIATLDTDEIDGLIKSVKLIIDKVFTETPTNYTEVYFRSRSGFEAGCFWSKDKWSTYIKLEKFDSRSYVFMDKDNFNQLMTLLEQAKTKL